MTWGLLVESCYGLGWTFTDVLQAPLKEIFRAHRSLMAQRYQDVNRTLAVVNTARSIVGADPIGPDQKKGKSRQKALDLIQRRKAHLDGSTD